AVATVAAPADGAAEPAGRADVVAATVGAAGEAAEQVGALRVARGQEAGAGQLGVRLRPHVLPREGGGGALDGAGLGLHAVGALVGAAVDHEDDAVGAPDAARDPVRAARPPAEAGHAEGLEPPGLLDRAAPAGDAGEHLAGHLGLG